MSDYDEATTLAWLPMTFREFIFYLTMLTIKPVRITWIRPRYVVRRPKLGAN